MPRIMRGRKRLGDTIPPPPVRNPIAAPTGSARTDHADESYWSGMSYGRLPAAEKYLCPHVQGQLAEFANGSSSVEEIHALMKQSDRCILEERNLILELEIADHADFDKPEQEVNRLVLSEYAHHVSMRRIQRTLLRALQARNMMLTHIEAEAVGRTA